MFVHVETRRRSSVRWATGLIVLLCLVGYVGLELLTPARRAGLLVDWGVVPAQWFDGQASAWHTDASWLRLCTATFLHVSWAHLLSNILFLAIFGWPAERALGSLRFLALFIIGGAVANLAGASTLAGSHSPIVGCSGAVSAVLGVYITLFPRANLGLVLPLGLYFEFVRAPAFLLIGIWILLQLLFSYSGAGHGAVVWWAHIAGFLFGIVFALLSRTVVRKRMHSL